MGPSQTVIPVFRASRLAGGFGCLLDGMQMSHAEVFLKVPSDLEPKLERQIREYNQLRAMGEQLGAQGLLDPSNLT